jgi:nitrogen-specific signal transduction histidine kinase
MEASNQKIKIRRHFDPSLPDVMADPDQLTQVFINLFKNGIDSMESEGTLTLSTRMLHGYQVLSAHEGKKGMVSVDVRDEGCGIEEEDLSKIFDPFYTRKAGGIGLGLALCHRIVEEHRGKIEVKSTPGKGTLFSVCLPIAIQSKSG